MIKFILLAEFLIVITLFYKVAAQTCYTGASDCFSGPTNAGLATYGACCGPLRSDSSIRRSFEDSSGYCHECILIGLDSAQYTFNENNTVYTHRLRLLAPPTNVMFARPRLQLNGIPGTASGNDFSIVTSDILLDPLVAGIDIAITISDDGIAGEPPETFTIVSRPPAVPTSNDPLFLFRDTTVTIIDINNPTYEFTEADYTENEGTPLIVVVRQTVSSVQDVHLLLVPLSYDEYISRATNDSTLAPIDAIQLNRPDAAELIDFTRETRAVFFAANSPIGTERRVFFPIPDDAIDEAQEGFLIVMYRDTNQTIIEVAFNRDLRTALGRINDNDPFFFGFVLNAVTYDEELDEGVQEVLYAPAPGNKTEKSFSFSLNLNAVQGGFVFGANGDVTFGAGVIRPTFTFRGDDIPEDRVITFSVIRDEIVEGQEIGQLQIARSTSFDGFEPQFQNLRIIINDANRAVFNLSAPAIVYEQLNRTFTAIIDLVEPSGGSSFQIEININDVPVTARRNGDYRRNGPPSQIFQGSDHPGCCVRNTPFLIRDDNVAEPDEVLELSIARSVASSSIPVDFIIDRVNVTIIDDDVAVIGFENVTFIVTEGVGFAEIPVAVLGTTTLGGEATVRFSTSDLTAIAGSDYNNTEIELTFSSSVNRIVVRVPIIDDDIAEINELFRASLTLLENNGLNVAIMLQQVNVTIIIDDDMATIGLENTLFIVSEGAGFVELPIAVLGTTTLGGEVTLQFSTSDLTASAGSDYINTVVELVFSAAVSRHVVMVPIRQDFISEINEQFRVTLAVVKNNGINVAIDPNMATVTITNHATAQICYTGASNCFSGSTDSSLATYESCCQSLRSDSTIRRSFGTANGNCYECIMIGLDQSMYTLNENNAVYVRRLKLIAPASNIIFVRPRLQLNGIPGTASENDFSIVRSDILLDPLVAGIDIAITISLDGIAGEPPETFTITSQSPAVSTPNDPLFLFRNTTVTIIDADKPTYEFTEADYTENEGSGVTVSVRQTIPSVQDIHLLLVPLTYDQYIARAAVDSTLAAINDIQLNRPDLAEYVEFDRTVRPLFFPANSSIGAERRVSFPIIDDIIDENQEGFLIVMYRDTNLTSIEVAFNRDLRTTLARINDNDPFFFGFVVNEVTYDEGLDEGLHEVLYAPAPGNITEKDFEFSLNLNALEGGFVFSASGDVTFGAGVIRPTFMFRANDPPEDRIVFFTVLRDEIVEGQEIGRLQIARSTSFDGFEPRFQNVRIVLNDSNRAVFNLSAPAIVYEQNLTFTATIDLVAPSGGSTVQIEIDITGIGITATRNADYRRSGSPSVIFQGSDHPGCCVRQILYLVRNDNIAEPNEVLTIYISRSGASASIPVDFVMQQVNVTIIDDDIATIGFENTSFIVSEETGFVELPIAVLGATTLGGAVTLQFSTSDLTATAGSDYTNTVMELVFSAAVNRHVVRVPITEDIIVEINEQFRATLTVVKNNGINVAINPNLATVTIINSHVTMIRIGFQMTNALRVQEGARFADLPVAVLSNITFGVEVVVRFSTQVNNSATAGLDYAGTVMNLTFSNSVRHIVVRIPILQDILSEGPEQFRSSLSLLEHNGIIVELSPYQAIVDIIDDDEIRIGFTKRVYDGVEGDFVRPVISILSGTLASGKSVAVHFLTAFLRARGQDFEQTEKILLFSSTNTSITVPVPLKSDSVYEHNEIFYCALRPQTTPLNVFVYPNRAILNIIDNSDVTVGFKVGTVDVPESINSVALIVEVTKGQLSHSISLQYSTSDGTATAGMDYHTVHGSITFTPTITQQTISIPIINDLARENKEMFTVHLTNGPARVTVAPNRASVYIKDNDSVVIGFDPKRDDFPEDSGRGQFTVRVISGLLNSSVTVLLNTASCVADSGVDFRPLQDVQLVFNSTQHSITVPFDIIKDDMDNETDEALMASIKLAVPIARVTLAPDEAEVTITETSDREG